MVIYYILDFDHKLLNLKNIMGTKTELYIYLHLFRQHVFIKCLLCTRHSDFFQVNLEH
jgi:hypothetical protein